MKLMLVATLSRAFTSLLHSSLVFDEKGNDKREAWHGRHAAGHAD